MNLLVAPSKTERRVAAVVALVWLAAAFVVDLAVANTGALIYAPAVALVGLYFGAAAGFVSGGLATTLYVGANDDATGTAVVARGIPFLIIGGLIGWLADRVRASELAHRRLIETANEGICITGQDGRISFANERLASMLGYEPDEIGGTPVDEFIAGGDSTVDDRFERRRRGESDEYEMALRHRDGRIVRALVRVSPLTDRDGDFVGSLSMITDITERKRVEEMLEEAEAIAHIGSWTWDVEQDVVAWSRELYRIYGIEPAELAPSLDGFLERVHRDDRERVREAIEAAYERREPFSFEHRVVRPDGAVRVLEARGAVHAGAGGVVRMAGVAHDVTERRRAEEEVVAARLARRQATELNDNVVQGLALAQYALARGDVEGARRFVDATLGQARRMISDLIGDVDVEPGDLRRERAAGLGG